MQEFMRTPDEKSEGKHIASEKSQSPERAGEVNETYIRNLGEELLYEYHEDAEMLSREERKKLETSKNPEDQARLVKYQKSKYRKNFFQKLKGFLFYALDEQIMPLRNLGELAIKREGLVEKIDKVDFGAGERVPREIVEESNKLLKEILESAKNSKK